MYRVKIRFYSEQTWETMRQILIHANVDYEAGKDEKGRYYLKIGKQRKPYLV
jgi:hypothetical protein